MFHRSNSHDPLRPTSGVGSAPVCSPSWACSHAGVVQTLEVFVLPGGQVMLMPNCAPNQHILPPIFVDLYWNRGTGCVGKPTKLSIITQSLWRRFSSSTATAIRTPKKNTWLSIDVTSDTCSHCLQICKQNVSCFCVLPEDSATGND
eukprot:5401431-Amphidinium_carterae.1